MRLRILLSLSLLAPSAVASRADVPVQIGGEQELDACAALDVVTLRTGRLAVRSGPGTRFRVLDRLPRGQHVYSCAVDPAGSDWVGVVYAPGKDSPDCGVSTPVAPRRTYDGPCKSGWVHTRWLSVIAG